jgi:flavin reductase (DIM6/NTAB) family NADH-FMN oxidoreductase RutF
MSSAPIAKRTLKPCTPVIPAPVVLVTCRDGAGNDNIITLAWVGVVNSAPPMVAVAIRPSRHSHPVVAASGEFGVNIPRRDQLALADHCGVVSGRNEDKFQATGFTRLPGTVIKAPLIAECPINIECTVVEQLHLGTHDLFIGEVVAVRVSEDCMRGDAIDVGKVAPVAFAPEAHQYWSLGELLGTYGYTTRK